MAMNIVLIFLEWHIVSCMLNVIFFSLNQGLKKLGQSIESSYSSIQKLVISHLQRYEDDVESFGVASART